MHDRLNCFIDQTKIDLCMLKIKKKIQSTIRINFDVFS